MELEMIIMKEIPKIITHKLYINMEIFILVNLKNNKRNLKMLYIFHHNYNIFTKGNIKMVLEMVFLLYITHLEISLREILLMVLKMVMVE